MQTVTDLEQQIATLQAQVQTLAKALRLAMRTPALQEHFSGGYDRYGGWLYQEDPDYCAVTDIAFPPTDDAAEMEDES